MKGKTWKRWGLLCVSAILGIGIVMAKSQAVEENRIYPMTGEEHFVFDTETQMITGYQDAGYTTGADDTLAGNTVQNPAAEKTVVIPAQIGGMKVKGLTGTFLNNINLQKVVIPDTLEILGDDAFNGCTSLSEIGVYRIGESFTEGQVTEKQQQEGNLKYVKADSAFDDLTTAPPDVTAGPDATGTPDTTTSPDATGTPDVTGTPGTSALADASDASGSQDDTSQEPSQTGDPVYYEVVESASCVVIPASLQSIGQRTFNSCAFSAFDVMEGSQFFKDSGEGGHNLAEGVGACLTSLDGSKLYRMAPGYGPNTGTNQQYSIPEGVKEIMPYAVQRVGWQIIAVPDTVETIASYAFYQSGLLGVTFTENAQVETIGDWAFAYNDNMDIILPASVKTIGTYCFAHIVNRTPDLSQTQITVIPEYAFMECPNLHTITMPSTLQTIENYAFAGNPNLNEVVFTGSTLSSIGTGAFQNCTNMHKIDIPAGITTIEPDTFSGCSNLNEVILPEGLLEIKDNAFSNCQNIHQMVIPSTVTSIAGNSFSGSNTQDIDTSKNAYAQSAIGGKTPTPSPSPVPTPVVPGAGYQKTIGKLVYKVVKSSATAGTVTVVKPASKAVTSVVIPASVDINGYRFQVVSVSAKAFAKCKKLKKVTIGVNVKSIGKQAFKNSKKLKRVIIKTKKLTKSSIGSGAFKNIAKKAVIKVPKTKLKAYKKILRKKGLGKKAKIKK